MIVIDTNIILRYLLNDNEELNKKATEIIENKESIFKIKRQLNLLLKHIVKII